VSAPVLANESYIGPADTLVALANTIEESAAFAQVLTMTNYSQDMMLLYVVAVASLRQYRP
jgi:hypothetical protein